MATFYKNTLYYYDSSLKYLEFLSSFDAFTEKMIRILDLTE